MAMTEAHKRYRARNPAHRKAEGEKRLDQIISGEAMAALAARCKSAGVTRRQMLEALLLSDWHHHTGVMVIPEITPGLSNAPSADKGIELIILEMAEGGFRKGESSPVPKQVVELFNGDYQEAARQVRRLASAHKGTPAHEDLKTLANRIDGSRPKKPKQKEKEQ